MHATIPSGHILVVDDDPVISREISRTVCELGHRATAVNSWTDAIRVFTTEDVDLVLMDAIMPIVDGFKLTRILRSKSTGYVPIVFLTGLADANAKMNGISAGADDFITKPCDPFELRTRLTAMLRIRWLTRDLEDKTRALAKLATIDGLTGIGNRRAFDERLVQEIEAAKRRSAPLSLLLFDLDHFKRTNDTLGHRAGDRFLVGFGKHLRDTSRACDVPFRYGGEEFALIAADTRSDQAFHLAERLRERWLLHGSSIAPGLVQTVSIGICGTDQLTGTITPDVLILAADKALYRAKAEGRNRSVISSLDRDSSQAA